jgi:hypothetical protein
MLASIASGSLRSVTSRWTGIGRRAAKAAASRDGPRSPDGCLRRSHGTPRCRPGLHSGRDWGILLPAGTPMTTSAGPAGGWLSNNGSWSLAATSSARVAPSASSRCSWRGIAVITGASRGLGLFQGRPGPRAGAGPCGVAKGISSAFPVGISPPRRSPARRGRPHPSPARGQACKNPGRRAWTASARVRVRPVVDARWGARGRR